MASQSVAEFREMGVAVTDFDALSQVTFDELKALYNVETFSREDNS